MKGWKDYKFSDFVNINPRVYLDSGLKYSFVEMKNVDSTKKYCEPSAYKLLTSGSRFINDDTLFARITPCLENGKIAKVHNLINGKGFGSTEFLVFRGKSGISDNDFIYYLSRWNEVRDFAESHMEGSSGRQRVSKNCFSSLIIHLPTLEEQRAIAAILSHLDDKIDLLHRQNATLEALAETLFRQWFVLEPKAEWVEKPLSEIASFLNGLACQKYRPSNPVERLPVLKIRELSCGISADSDWASSAVPQKYIIQFGDVIFSWSGSLMVKIWNGEDCILNQHLFKVTSRAYPKWFYYFWCKQHLNEFISISESKATTMGHIKRGDLDAAMVRVPDSSEILRMSTRIEPYLSKLIQNASQIRTLENLRDTLLPRLMSGEVRVDL